MKCIYCLKESSEVSFKSREHVIPQSFGTFGPKTPTLDCVCDSCNSFFGQELDQVFARDSWEGITRYKKALKSREKRPLKRIRIALAEDEEMGEFGGVILGGVDGITGQLLPPPPQFRIRNKKTGKFDVFLKDEIKNLKLDNEIYGPEGTREVGIHGHETEHQGVIDELKKIGLNYKEKSRHQLPLLRGKRDGDNMELPVTLQGIIDSVIKRALVKILINFAAYYIGSDEVLKSEWDKGRNFVRCNGKSLLGRMSEKPFWDGQETKNVRLESDSVNIRIENQNSHLVGVIQFYNLFTYEFILVGDYILPPEKEIAYRFTPGQEPFFGIKMIKKT